MLYAIDRVYIAYGGIRGPVGVGTGVGVERTEKPVTRGFTVTATQRGELVDVKVEPFAARPGRTDPANRQIQKMLTQLTVKPGQWVTVGGGSDVPEFERSGKTYGTSAKLAESLVLIKVEPAGQ